MTEAAYAELVAATTRDDRVVGLVLTGSRGRRVHVQPTSDWDVRLVVEDDAREACEERYATVRGSPVEVVVLTLSEFERAGAIGSANEWDRYSYCHAEIVLDKLDGEIGAALAEKTVLPPEAADMLAAAALDAYVNSYYRSAKNLRAGLKLESHLDAAESVGHVLNALFGLHRRVRPFNKFLLWELEGFPVPGAAWQADRLLPLLEDIVASGGLPQQQQLFGDMERLARERGHGAVIDGWEPDVAFLRGGPP